MISGLVARFLRDRVKSLISGVDKDKIKTDIIGLAQPVISGHGAELVDVEIKGARGYELVKLYIYKDDGVSLSLCEQVSREVADLFDVEDPIPGRYRLEVTSPGLDRPLESNRDFIRANGHVLKAKLKSGQVVKGRLVSSDDQQVLLETGTEVVTVPRIEIAKANIEPEF